MPTPCEPSSAWPRKNAQKLVTIPTTRTSAPAISTLLHRNVPRCGTAASELRIMPVLYSAETMSTPNAIMASCPMPIPAKLV